jgi:glycosyltransferase involved in cell wall biosynthesis
MAYGTMPPTGAGGPCTHRTGRIFVHARHARSGGSIQLISPYAAREFVVGYGARDIEGDPGAQKAAFLATVPEVRDRKIILFLSRIHPKKGVDLLIQAFARHATTHLEFDLLIAGPDQTGWKSELQELAKKLGVADRIFWPGMLSGDAKWGAFRAAEFFALPSQRENFGIVVAEAMALSRPLLIPNKVNIWREIEADGAGLVVDDDVEAIAAGHEMCSLSARSVTPSAARRRNVFSTVTISRKRLAALGVPGGPVGGP